ncbi:A2ML1 protein, partial [Ptilonorhynchus violaceus]|nr:A2ML1 protein [Ptilonorhynchus violaceus]
VSPPADGTEEVATVKLTITGNGVNIEEQKKVLICKARSGTIIQTDRPIYQAGQTVKFRIVTLDEEFLPLNDSVSHDMLGQLFLSFSWVQDPKNNQIEQWQNVVPQDGIAELSFQLSDEPVLGTYVINVTSARAYGSFSVKEHVLPKFEVTFEAPNQIYALDTTFPLRVCGRYTRGKSIQGMVHVSLCQKIAPFLPSASKPDLCHKFSNQTDEAGCFFTNVSLSSFSRDFRYYGDSIAAEASLVEDATGVQINTSSQILISRTAARAVFETPNEYYIPGVPYRGKLKVQDHYGTGMKNRKVYLVIRFMRRRFIKTYITDDSGIASFNLDTTAWNSSSVSLEGRFTLEELMRTPRRTDFSYTNAYHHLQPFHVTTKSFLDIHPPTETLPCGLKQDVQVTFTLSRDDLGEDTSRISFVYYVTGKSGIVVRGQRNIQIGKLNMLKGSFSIPLTFTADLSPSPSLVVYAIFPSGGVTADSIRFHVALCFQNQAKVGLPDKEAQAGSAVQLGLQAAPGSLCAVQAVDENTFYRRPDHELTSQMVYGLFPAAYQRGYPAQVEEHSDRCVQPQSSSSLLQGRPHNSFQPDIFNLFRNMGLKVFSNLVIKKPSQCSRRVDRKPVMGVPSTEDQRITKEQPQFTTPGRRHHYFPETWIWNLYSVGSNGSRNVSVTAPAAAAEWKVKMFCLAGKGFGLAPTTSLRTVQPFFVDMTVPYSVIRGETFLMKATVFSYLQQCIQIHVSLAKSSDFQV